MYFKRFTNFFWVLALQVLPFVVFAQPTNNPIAEYYSGPEGYPLWTDEFNWGNVYNMATYDYSGCATCTGNDFEKFKYVRDIAYAAGGGVLYYPAGTYTFDISDAPNSEGLMLKKGVVIRGEKPASDAAAVLPNPEIKTMGVTEHGLNNLPTKFKFTTTRLANDTLDGDIGKMWNCIGIKKGSNETSLQQVEKVGIAWVEIEYGYIYFGFDTETGWATTYGTASQGWARPIEPWKSGRNPDGTHPMDWFAGNKDWGQNRLRMGQKRFVFGVHIKQGGVPNYVLAHGMGPAFYCEDAPYWFGAKISLYGSHLLVANNVVSKPTKCFKMKITTGAKKDGQNASLPVGTVVEVPYDFGKGLSVDVNKNYVAGFKNNSAVQDPNSQYAPDVIIEDNWIYNHSNKGFDIAGSWMVVRNNINRRERLDFTDVYNLGLTNFYGVMHSNGRIWTGLWNDDFMARAFTVSSFNAWYHKNQFIRTGTAFDNSGEGILHQDHLNGSECYSAAVTYNRGTSYMGVWNSFATGYFAGFNEVSVPILVANPSGWASDLSSVSHRDINNGTEYFFSQALASDPVVKDFKSWNCANPNPTPGTPIAQVADSGLYVHVSWLDVADEAAYRIERRRENETEWTPIAYRPRQETGAVVSFNGPAPALTNPGGHGSDAFDGQIRDMNPKVWRDYMKTPGTFLYRVVAVGCGDENTSVSDSLPVVVVSNRERATVPTSLRAYPVPSQHLVHVTGIGRQQSAVVYDLHGRVIQTLHPLPGEILTLDVRSWTPGVYLLKTMGDATSRPIRFVVE